MNNAYDEAIDFLAAGVTPESLIAFQPSHEALVRFEHLIGKEKCEGLLPEETEELDRLMEIERLMSLAKARARKNLKFTTAA
ncbi:hypothetical protein [Prosthecobacter fusiformis]|uniref:hypothetical protein n=1 Tax=Prosthecobacter fusiformis TaxID=48464 RepID=UPI0010623721|nr:hypothetical protein [Prosthecobacter fusiformis]